MKLEHLAEALTRRGLLKLQQLFIDKLDDNWDVGLDETGLVFSHEDGVQARLDDLSYPAITTRSPGASAPNLVDHEQYADIIKQRFADRNIRYVRVNVSFDYNLGTVFTITCPTVNDAVSVLIDSYGYTYDELLLHPSEIDSLVDVMDNIIIM